MLSHALENSITQHFGKEALALNGERPLSPTKFVDNAVSRCAYTLRACRTSASQYRNLLTELLSSYRAKAEFCFSKIIAIFFVFACLVAGADSLQAVEIDLPPPNPGSSIAVSSEEAWSWREGRYEVWHLRGNVSLKQSPVAVQSEEAVIWLLRASSREEPSRVIAFFEGQVDVKDVARSTRDSVLRDKQWLARFETKSQIELDVPLTGPEPVSRPPIYRKALAARGIDAEEVKPAQFVVPNNQPAINNPVPPAAGLPQATVAPEAINAQPQPTLAVPTQPRAILPSSIKRVQVWPRSSVRWQARSERNPNNPAEQITTVTSGVQVVIESNTEFGTVTIETDRIVIWSPPMNMGGVSPDNPLRADGPIELYLEGNIVFRQGDRLIYADRMYYNASQEYGVVLAAEMLTPVKDYQGLVRLKADVLQQIDKQNFQAYGAALTTSRLGVPGYWLQSERITFEDRQTLAADSRTDQFAADPATGEVDPEHQMMATSRNNFLYFSQIPVFYWPYLATDLKKPTFYITNLTIKNDTIFGVQSLVDYDLYQILGITQPAKGTNWTLSTDYLSERGAALGTRFDYNRNTLFGLPGPAYGFIDAWGIHDTGNDVLGLDRLNVTHPNDVRGRLLARHRHQLPRNFQLSAEVGYISDDNFLEQYFEREWDLQKDQTTGVELKQYLENGTWAVSADVRTNNLFAQTEDLRLDHFALGQEFLFDRATWYAHSDVSYSHLQPSGFPDNPTDAAKYQRLPWEVDAEGVRAVSRQEVDLPVDLGPVKFVPYLLGEGAYYGEDINGESIGRAYGQAGMRASMPVWSVNPDVSSNLLNVNGIANKIVFEGEFLYADASQNLDRFPLYEQLDDDSTEHFRRRQLFNTFGLTFGDQIPLQYQERNFAFRSGMQSWVTAQSTEIADDLMMGRLGMRQRIQTKRGPVGNEHIIDWITFDLDASLFPKPDRDNFGEVLGMVNYDFAWHVGDRLSLLSDGYADVFEGGLRQVTVGANLGRPDSGNVYLGFRSTEGPISSSVLLAYVNYRMSEKWIANAGASFDFGNTGNIGQTLGVTRIGEAFLVTVNGNYDASRESLGVFFSIEPRFLPTGKQGVVNGVRVPPAGTFGLE